MSSWLWKLRILPSFDTRAVRELMELLGFVLDQEKEAWELSADKLFTPEFERFLLEIAFDCFAAQVASEELREICELISAQERVAINWPLIIDIRCKLLGSVHELIPVLLDKLPKLPEADSVLRMEWDLGATEPENSISLNEFSKRGFQSRNGNGKNFGGSDYVSSRIINDAIDPFHSASLDSQHIRPQHSRISSSLMHKFSDMKQKVAQNFSFHHNPKLSSVAVQQPPRLGFFESSSSSGLDMKVAPIYCPKCAMLLDGKAKIICPHCQQLF